MFSYVHCFFRFFFGYLKLHSPGLALFNAGMASEFQWIVSRGSVSYSAWVSFIGSNAVWCLPQHYNTSAFWQYSVAGEKAGLEAW